jgi:hypothetical protein
MQTKMPKQEGVEEILSVTRLGFMRSKWLELIAKRSDQTTVGGMALWTRPGFLWPSRAHPVAAANLSIITVSVAIDECLEFTTPTAFDLERVVELLAAGDCITKDAPSLSPARADEPIRFEAILGRKHCFGIGD